MKYDFDNWRQRYQNSTLEDQISDHNQIGAIYPNQAHYMLGPVLTLMADRSLQHVVEAGPWMAHLANAILSEPAYDHIQSWSGYEIADFAIERCVCEDQRFQYIVPKRFDWWKDGVKPGSIFIATHFIEHLSDQHMLELASALQTFPLIYFEAPISEYGQTWEGYEGTHMLTLGWDAVIKMFPFHRLNESYTSESTRMLWLPM